MTSRYFRPRLAITVLASIIYAPAFAQHHVQQLDQVVVTAARTPQPLQNAVGDITVINQKELAKAGQNSVAEILSRQPGIEFYSNGGPQTVSGVSIRGANPGQTLVLMNGMRINSSVTGGINWNAIDPASIERIEIIRGAGSSLYGADAIGGVINIITKSGSKDRPLEFYGSVGVGSHKTIKSSVGLDGASNGFSYSLNASYAKSKGFNATNKDNFNYFGDKDGYHSNAFTGSLGYEWANDQQIGINAYNSHINGDFDYGDFDWLGNDVRDAFTQTRQQSYDIYSKNRLTKNWLSTLTFGLSKEQSSTPVYDSKFSTLQRQYSWQNDVSLTENQDVSLIVERLEERISHNDNYTDTRRNTNSFAGIYRADFGPHNIQVSLRNDNISGYGNRTTGGLGYDFSINEHWTIGTAANTGFNAPNFGQLYAPGGYANPNLSPEKSRNIEAHLAFDNDTSQFKITAFQNKIHDLITSSAETNYVPYNIEKATIRGVSLYGTHDFGNVNLWASADFFNPKNDSTGKQLRYRAKQNIKIGTEYQWKDLGLGAEYQYTSKRYDDDQNSSDKRLNSYSLVNLTGSYAIHKNLNAHLRWNNIFDKKHYSAYGYNMPGSNVFLNVSWRM